MRVKRGLKKSLFLLYSSKRTNDGQGLNKGVVGEKPTPIAGEY